MSRSRIPPTPTPTSEPAPTAGPDAEEEEGLFVPGAWLLDLLAEITFGSREVLPSATDEQLGQG